MNDKSKEIREIKVTNKNSELLEMKESFNKRWNIIDNEENKNQLKNRCLAIICNSLNNIYGYHGRRETIENFCSEVEITLGISIKENYYDKFDGTKLFKYINALDLNIVSDYNTFMYFLEISLNYDYDYDYEYDSPFVDNELLAKRMAEVLKLSNANVIICKNGDRFELYPIDVPFLSEKLVMDVLSWLDLYPNTKKSFSKALKIKRTPDKYRNIIDELRLSVEFLFKQVFNNNKSLENQKSNIGDFFKENNVSVEISNMYIKLMDLYTTYNNNSAKHNDNVNEIEIDYMIYLTGSFIRFILLIEKNQNKV